MGYEKVVKNFIFDLETLGKTADSVIVAAAFLVFDLNKKYTFKELVKNALYVKFDVKDQKKAGRKIDPGTVEWWKSQNIDAQKELLPTKNDLSMVNAIQTITDYLNKNGISNSKNVMGWCRGTSFDFPMITNMYIQNNSEHLWLCDFWNQKDVRTYIGATVGDHSINKIDLPKEILTESQFTAHDCRHDIARDVLMIQYANKIAYDE
jgi:hypothetical protein